MIKRTQYNVIPCNPKILQNNFILTWNHGFAQLPSHKLSPCCYSPRIKPGSHCVSLALLSSDKTQYYDAGCGQSSSIDAQFHQKTCCPSVRLYKLMWHHISRVSKRELFAVYKLMWRLLKSCYVPPQINQFTRV